MNAAQHAGAPGPAQSHAGPEDPVLTSKITVPGLPAWAVTRPRIEQRITESVRGGSLTVVTGPPGAGKTMAIASWLAHHRRRGPTAWVTLDEYDNHPRAFWSYVLEALRRAGCAVPSGSLDGSRRGPNHVHLLRLAYTLAAQSPPVVLVVDDLHLVTQRKALEGLAYVLRHARPGLHVIASSRIQPPLPLHQYRLTGELAELRAQDLTFNAAEASSLMAQHGVSLRPESLESLIARTEGWGAGLRLAAISMAGHPSPEEFVQSLISEGNAIADYLMAEALNTQSPAVREFLLKTSILDSFNADIAAEVTDAARAERTVAELARSNAFVQALGGGWYRYHRLFAEVLLMRLRRQTPDRVPDLHRRAAQWHRRHGRLIEGVRHAVQAGDWQLAAEMAVGDLAVASLIEPIGDKRLLDEFRCIPRNVPWKRPQPALIVAALALSGGEVRASAASLDAAEDLLARLPADREMPSRLAATQIRLGICRRTGNLAAAGVATKEAQTLLDRFSADLLERHPELRPQILLGRGAAEFWSGNLEEAAHNLDEGAAAASGLSRERADCLGYLALAEALRGELSEAAKHSAAARAAADDGGAGPGEHPNPPAEVAQAWVHLERGELHEVRGPLRRADAGLDVRPDRLTAATACLVAARASLAQGRANAAVEMVSLARRGWSLPPWLEQRLTLAESRAYAMAGDTKAAWDAAESVGPESAFEAAVELANAAAAAGNARTASRALVSVLAGPGDVPDHVRLDAWLVDARLKYDGGDWAEARLSLERALRLGQRSQIRLPFVMERSWIRRVLREDTALAHAHRHLFGSVLARRDASASAAPPPVAAAAEPAIVEPLSEREREVLRHVAGLLSTVEIAAEMYISVNTVKTHLKSIYRKLAVAHRGEAVRRARQLRLL
jgi:LuxR family transcriptional regulator, maltose regulon positive regulatory protein